MRRVALAASLLAVLGALAGPAYAKQPALPKITGGGQATNNNSGNPTFPMQVAQFGFNAQATGAGVVTDHPVFAQNGTVYTAKGEFQGHNSDANDPSTTVSEGHGDVVCINNMGPSSGVDGGGNPSGDVWEIRVAFDVNGTTIYGSILTQDGETDYIDESFADPFNPNCGSATFFQLEPVTNGQIKVH